MKFFAEQFNSGSLQSDATIVQCVWSEIGRNKRYVLALPARYNYALPIGWEEVERIIAENSLQPY
jgi:hypothetical protein